MNSLIVMWTVYLDEMDIIETALEIITFDFWVFGMQISLIYQIESLSSCLPISYTPGSNVFKNNPRALSDLNYLKAWVFYL